MVLSRWNFIGIAVVRLICPLCKELLHDGKIAMKAICRVNAAR